MAKNRPPTLLHNLLALALAITAAALAYLFFGRGLPFQIALALLFSLPWTLQFLVLAVAANARQPPPPYISKLTFALWGAASYHFSWLMMPPGTFPDWVVPASAPIGFLLCYALIVAFLWMMTLIRPWRLPGARND